MLTSIVTILIIAVAHCPLLVVVSTKVYLAICVVVVNYINAVVHSTAVGLNMCLSKILHCSRAQFDQLLHHQCCQYQSLLHSHSSSCHPLRRAPIGWYARFMSMILPPANGVLVSSSACVACASLRYGQAFCNMVTAVPALIELHLPVESTHKQCEVLCHYLH